MTIVLACLAALVAAVIQRITGLAFVLVLIGPIVLLYGPLEGVTIALLLALVASLTAVPFVWGDVDWTRTLWLVWPGLVAAPFGALLVTLLPEPAVLLTVAGMAFAALLAGRATVLSAAVRGRRGAVAAGAVSGFMHAASGLSGPALAAYAVGDRWPQRRFAASAQVIFVAFSVIALLLRGLPSSPPLDVLAPAAATVLGIALGSLLSRVVPLPVARAAMLLFAWLGAGVVLVRGVVALVAPLG